jgi:hypothetical protein
VGGDDAQGKDATDQEDAESASGPVEADEGPVAGVAEAGFAGNTEAVIKVGVNENYASSQTLA